MTPLSLEQIQKELETTEVTPSRAADLGVIVSAKHGRACDAYNEAYALYARKFNEIRPEFKSDTSAERHIDNSEIGINLHTWKWTIKKAEMIQKALNNLVYVKTAEARNQI